MARSAKGRAPAAATNKKAAKPKGKLRVRMYRVGFGDFFLLTVPSAGGPQHVLIDCGVHSGTTGKGDIGTLRAAVADLAKETGGRLALIVMTHRHADHISGFSRCADQFASFKADAVWMPAWEREYDQTAFAFQAELHAMAERLQTHLAAREDREGVAMLDMLHNATGTAPMGAAKGGGSNAKSLEILKSGFGVAPDYYAANDAPKLPKALAAAGLGARILGPPPIDDIAFLKLMDLKKGVGQYLDAAEGQRHDARAFRPFGDVWTAGPGDYGARAFDEWAPRDAQGKPLSDPEARHHEVMEKILQDAQPSALFTAVKTLDGFLNNQSLVVLFTFAGKKLLFVGDAQAGSWEHWLYEGGEPTTTPSGALAAKSAELLASLDFYKVGHHGSTNATPIAAVEAMGKGLVAMCSTEEKTYGTESKGTEVPRVPLLAALDDKCALVRSDQIAVEVGGEVRPPGEKAPKALAKPKKGKLVRGDFYIDYLL